MLIVHCRWLGIFNGVSAFNNSGMSLLDANMVRCTFKIPLFSSIR
jgi:Trk-type K+ transport system membrane component